MTTDGIGAGVDVEVSARAREQALADTFVALADTLVEDYDVVELLHQLATACVDLLDVTAAGLLLADQRGNLSVVASSKESTHLLDAFRVQTHEGPSLDCVQGGTVVSSGNLAGQRARWPLFAPAAVQAGYQSVAALPLRLRDQTIGALNLFGAAADPIPVPGQRLAQALADVATIGILQHRSLHHSTMLSEQLQFALTSRVAVEQAKGVLAERNSASMEDAFEALRKHARNNNLKLTAVADAVILGTIDPATISHPTVVHTRSHP